MYSPRSVSTGGDAVLTARWALMPELLADHGLALGDGAGAGGLADLQHGSAGLVGGAAPVDLSAGGDDAGFELLEVEVEVGEGVVLDVARGVAQLFEFRQGGDGAGTAFDERGLADAEGLLQTAVGQRPGGVTLESRAGDVHGWKLRANPGRAEERGCNDGDGLVGVQGQNPWACLSSPAACAADISACRRAPTRVSDCGWCCAG